MIQPKNFGFEEDETMLRDAASRFFSEQLPTDKLHALIGDTPEPHQGAACRWDRALWTQMVELGWAQLAVPETAGGLGFSSVGVIGLVEAAGRAACPGPLLMNLCSSYVLAACDSDGATAALDQIVEGQAATLAITNSHGSWQPSDTDVAIVDGRLRGTAYYVQDAAKADFFVVSACTEMGIGLYQVSRTADGLKLLGDAIVDLSRDQARLSFDNVEAVELCTPGDGASILSSAWPALLTLLAADMVGAAEWQLQTTVEYAQTREQFGHTLGFFQAVKHPLVDLMTAIDHARSLTYNAACALDTEPDQALKYALMAQSAACEAAAMGSSRSVQYHGGIGFTWECYVQLYFKRQKHSEMWLGDGSYQRAQLAELLIDAA